MTKILVTGGSGFIGKHLVARLAQLGHEVRSLDPRPPADTPPQVEHVAGSVLDTNLVNECLRDVDQVYHLAGLPGMWMPQKDDFDAVNFRGTEIVLATARKRGVTRFLHCSTESILFPSSREAVTGLDAPPADEMPGRYTRSKRLAEQLAMQAAASGFPVVVGTPTMPIGPHDHNLTPPTAMLHHFLNKRLRLYLDFIVNLVDVRDVASGLVLAMERGQVGHRYILGGESIPLKQILQTVSEISGRRSLHIAVPGAIAGKAAAVLEFIADHVTRQPPSGTEEGVKIALRATALSSEKAKCELGYDPRPIEPALQETIAYLLKTYGHRKQV
jgi:dihydroflavonol-4-reductase